MTTKIFRARFWLVLASSVGLLAGCDGFGEVEVAYSDPEETLSVEEIIDSYDADDGWYVSPVLEAPDKTTRAAILVELRAGFEEADIGVQARGVPASGSEGNWLPLEETFREEQFVTARVDLGFEAAGLRIRLPAEEIEALAVLHLAAANPELAAQVDAPIELDAGELESQEQALTSSQQSALGVRYRSRSAWGARSSRGCGGDVAKYRMAIHHTGGGASASDAAIRGIQNWHISGRGWCDIGYHYLVDRRGTVYQGRLISRTGAHVLGHNRGNIGISLVGCYDSRVCGSINQSTGSSAVPSSEIIDSTGRLVGVLARSNGISINRTRIRGHGEHSGSTSTCPGNNVLARMSTILGIARSGSAPPPPEPECRSDDACGSNEICVSESCRAVGCSAVTRIAGANRFATAVEISSSHFQDGAETVVIAAGTDSPDALIAAPLARSLGAPLLLSAPEHLPSETSAEIGRLGAGRAVLVGGTGVLGTGVASALENLGLTVARVAGPDRFATAATVARQMGSEHALAFVASGSALVDALASAGPAAALQAPILYVRRDEVPDVTRAALVDLGIERTVVIGGTAVVSDDVLSSLPGALRVAGSNRYETAEAVAAFARDKGVATGRIYLARSDVFADAVPAGALGSALVLSSSDGLSSAARSFIRANSTRVSLLGGPSALSARVEHEACGAAAHTPKTYGGGGSCARVDRIAGANRFETAAAMSEAFFPAGASIAVLASDDGIVDGLTAGPLANSLGGPLLLTAGDRLPGDTSAEIARLGASEVVVVGGEAVVSSAVVTDLQALGVAVTRIAGQSRWQTAALVAERVGGGAGKAFIVSGRDDSLIDALAAAGAASALGAPVLLTAADELPPDTAATLSSLGIAQAIVVGGDAAVSEGVLSQLSSMGLSVSRVAGSDRFATAAAMTGFMLQHGLAGTQVFVTRGDMLLDGLSAAALGRPVLLSRGTHLNPLSARHLAFEAERAVLVGGTAALSTTVEGGACRALAW